VGSKQNARYFTYNIEPLGGVEPDFSGMPDHEIGLVRHYLHRSADVPHYGKEELRPGKDENVAADSSSVSG
ncbi:MAG: hypothetical protein ABEK84_03760, partial [Salinibacter sp.]